MDEKSSNLPVRGLQRAEFELELDGSEYFLAAGLHHLHCSCSSMQRGWRQVGRGGLGRHRE
jgi:hypothetical protein